MDILSVCTVPNSMYPSAVTLFYSFVDFMKEKEGVGFWGLWGHAHIRRSDQVQERDEATAA